MHFESGLYIGQDQDAWHIDPVTSMVRPADALLDPAVIVVERTASLASAIAEVCAFLHIRVEPVISILDLAEAMKQVRPIAVLSEAGEVDCAVYDLLMSIAAYDPGLPVLIVLNNLAMPRDEQLRMRRALDAAQRLWQLTGVTRIARRPGIRALIDFLFVAGRRSGAGIEA